MAEIECWPNELNSKDKAVAGWMKFINSCSKTCDRIKRIIHPNCWKCTSPFYYRFPFLIQYNKWPHKVVTSDCPIESVLDEKVKRVLCDLFCVISRRVEKFIVVRILVILCKPYQHTPMFFFYSENQSETTRQNTTLDFSELSRLNSFPKDLIQQRKMKVKKIVFFLFLNMFSVGA